VGCSPDPSVLKQTVRGHEPRRAARLNASHPDVTEVVDVTSVPDQMTIFDTLAKCRRQSDYAPMNLVDPITKDLDGPEFAAHREDF
jgi:hypothetical protein